MRLPTNISTARAAGASLIECLVYIAVFAILLGIGTGTFFFCWDHTRAVLYATNDIESALRAGEGWRADVRAATGKITVETTTTGEVVTIPEAGENIFYRFAGGELRRQVASENISQLVLSKVKTSEIRADPRGKVAAWRWEVTLLERRKEMHMPLLFTFEAVAKNTP
jgi:Tfp pilus assembly protein FimT